MPANILNLPQFNVLKVSEDDHDYRIEVEVSYLPRYCPHCNCQELVGFGRHREVVMDTPIHGKRVGIWLDRRRFRCGDCGKTFYESIPAKDNKRHATARLVQYIEKQSLVRTFAQISEEVGIDEKTVRNIFHDYAERMEATTHFETPRCLGIDEIHVIRKPRCVITNIEEQTMVAMLENRNKPTVIRYLSGLKDRERIQLVAMDMWKPYKDAVSGCLPKATIVIDKFHVVRMANDAMESARKSVRADLTPKQRRGLMRDRFVLLRRKRELSMPEMISFDTWTKNYPAIGEAYELKEAFYAIWERATSRAMAERAYAAWEGCLDPHMMSHFKPLVTAMTNWHNEIFAYFDHPITNAYTESLNNLIRFTNRGGRGYSFAALRAKVLFTQGFHKTKTKRANYRRDPDAWGYTLGRSAYIEPETVNYGTPISTLVRELQNQ